jgi:5'-3' exonuclease
VKAGKKPKKAKGRRMSFNGTVVHSAELADTAMKEVGWKGSITSNLPAVETLVMSLAAAERHIMNLEKDNDNNICQIILITKQQEATKAEADKLHLVVEKLELSLANTKKDLIALKYKGHVEDKQLEQRIRETSQLKSELHQLRTRTDPLIANLTAKVNISF